MSPQSDGLIELTLSRMHRSCDAGAGRLVDRAAPVRRRPASGSLLLLLLLLPLLVAAIGCLASAGHTGARLGPLHRLQHATASGRPELATNVSLQQQQVPPRNKRQPAARLEPLTKELLQSKARLPLQLSHHILCEPISQTNDLKLVCPHERQFIVILEAYYSGLFPEHVCPNADTEASKLKQLTGSQLVNIFKQLYSPTTAAHQQQQQPPPPTTTSKNLLKFYPTLNGNPYCLDDLKESFRAKCSGRQRCNFSRQTDHQFAPCASRRPGHLFLRYLCVDEALLIRFCNADELLASHTSVQTRLRRHSEYATDMPPQIDTLDFGFVASPGYPNFYATPSEAGEHQQCGWTIEAEIGQRVTVKLLDASLAPHSSPKAEAELDFQNGLWPTTEPAASTTEPPDLGASSKSNVIFERNESAKRVLFKIEPHDYEILRTSLAHKLEQVTSRCQGFDQLILRDSSSADSQNSNDTSELELISRLPVNLYKNQLIDFSNRTIYGAKEGGEPDDRRIDYQALVENLNPLQLAWLYQANVTLCSISQQEQLSSPQHKQKISFTSTSNYIQLDLASGRVFNPTSRGVLFWYHKHGCPATLKLPSRVKIAFRNESIEIFRCFDGFVFADTRQSERVRLCHQHDQVWRDAGSDWNSTSVLPGCVYIEELTSLVRHQNMGLSTDGHFERLTALSMPASAAQQAIADTEEAVVEVVGVPTTTHLNQDFSEDTYTQDTGGRSTSIADFDRPQPAASLPSNASSLARLFDTMLSYLNPVTDAGANSYRFLRHQMSIDEESSLLARTSMLFDRRMIGPILLMLFVFLLINLMIYVIFIVALPKFAKFLCYPRNRSKASPSKQRHRPASKLSHYESEYSVSMGLSL